MSTVFQCACYCAFLLAGAGAAFRLPWWSFAIMAVCGHICYHASIVLRKEEPK